jgi:putative OPT family oligopeptide transporter
MGILYSFVIENVGLGIFMAVLLLFCGFLFSAVGAYMAGIVGSSNNPISGITLTTMILSSAVLLGFLGMRNPLGPPAAILIGAVVCCAAAIAGDNMQDLKAGHIVGISRVFPGLFTYFRVYTACVTDNAISGSYCSYFHFSSDNK